MMDQEKELEKLVFGDSGTFQQTLDADHLENKDNVSSQTGQELDSVQDADLFFIDEGQAKKPVDISMSDDENLSDGSDKEVAWLDSDDERVQISLRSNPTIKKLRRTLDDDVVNGSEYVRRLRSRYSKMFPVPKWVTSKEVREDSDRDMDSEDENIYANKSDPLAQILKCRSSYVSKTKSRLLPPTTIDITALADSGASSQNGKSILSIAFHPSHPLLLSSGYDQLALISYIDGKKNPVSASLHVRKSVYQHVEFHPDGKTAILGSERKGLQFWDILSGNTETLKVFRNSNQRQSRFNSVSLSKDGQYLAILGSNGWMDILSSVTSQRICGVKIETGEIADVAWISDSSKLIIAATSGVIYEWDIATRQFTSRWQDAGGAGVTRIAVGGGPSNDRYIAIGSNSGIVSIHDRFNLAVSITISHLEPPICKPKTTLEQLVTPVTSLTFSGDGQILAYASNKAMSAMRIAHVPSFTAFKNWPVQTTRLGHVNAIAFSPSTEMMALAMEEGRIRLWRLEHYAQ